MVHDSLVNAAPYHSLGPALAAGLRYLRDLDPAASDGSYEIADGLRAIVQSYDTAPGAEKRFESHRRHIDIQYVVSGRERILHAPTESLGVHTPYSDDADIAFHQDPGASSSILLHAGDFVILYPHDAHKPGCMAGGRDRVKKVVVKVRI
jgi:biofilm protein TabA